MAIISFEHEHREFFTYPSVEGDVELLGQFPLKEAIINDNFTGASKATATFLVPSIDWVRNVLSPGVDSSLNEIGKRRALWVSLRNREGFNQTFLYDENSVTVTPEYGGHWKVSVNLIDMRGKIDNFPTLYGTDGLNLVGLKSDLLTQLTSRLSNAPMTGKNSFQLLPILPYDKDWVPTEEQAARGFVHGATVDDGIPVEIPSTDPTSLRDSYENLMTLWSPDLELFPLQITGEDGFNAPFFRWVLRRRTQTSVVLSEYGGGFVLDAIAFEHAKTDTLNYRNDDRTKYSYAGGTSLGMPALNGPWLGVDFEQVSIHKDEDPDFVPRPKLPNRWKISGKGRLEQIINPGSFGFFRSGEALTTVYFDTVSSYIGSSGFNLGSIYSEGVSIDTEAGEVVDTNSTIIAVSGSTTYTIPMNQAPLPAGGATYAVYEGSTKLTEETFFSNPNSSVFNNILTVEVGDLNEHVLTIVRTDAEEIYGYGLFGKTNCWDGTLYNAGNSVFNYLTKIVQLPLHGYLREQEHSVHGTIHALYTYALAAETPTLTEVPAVELWDGWNTEASIKNLFGYGPLQGTELTRAWRAPFESMFENCSGLKNVSIEADWDSVEKLASGYRIRFMKGCSSLEAAYPRFGSFSKVSEIVQLGASVGFYQEAFMDSSLTGGHTLAVHFESLNDIEDGMLASTFRNNDLITSLTLTVSFNSNNLSGQNFGSYIAAASDALISFSLTFSSSIRNLSHGFLRNSVADNINLEAFLLDGTEALETVGDDFLRTAINGSTLNAQKLTTVSFPKWNSLTTVGDRFLHEVLYQSGKLTTVALPELLALKTAGADFFYRVVNTANDLAVIELPKLASLESVGNNFMREGIGRSNANSLTALSLPTLDALKTIGNNFMMNFMGNRHNNIGSIAMPTMNAVETIGNSFMESFLSRGVISVAFPKLENAISIGGSFLYGVAWSSATASLTTIAQMPELYAVETVGTNFMSYSFRNCSLLTSTITFLGLENLETSGNNFFSNTFRAASSLTKVNLPVLSSFLESSFSTFIDTFYDCSSLTEVSSLHAWKVSSFSTNFLSGTFRGCVSLVNAPIMPDFSGLSAILNQNNFLDSTFRGCSNLAELPDLDLSGVVSIRSSTRVFAEYARDCSSITEVKMPFSVITDFYSIGNFFLRAYSGCSALTEFLSWPDFSGVTTTNAWNFATSFFSYAFENCIALESVPSFETFGGENSSSGSNDIFRGTFSGCSALTTVVNLPSMPDMSRVGNYFMAEFFSGCSALTTIPPVPSMAALTNIGTYFLAQIALNCIALTAAPALPASLPLATTTGNYLLYEIFRGCLAMTTATTMPIFGDTSLGTNAFTRAFYGTALTAGQEIMPAAYKTGYTVGTNYMAQMFGDTGLGDGDALWTDATGITAGVNLVPANVWTA